MPPPLENTRAALATVPPVMVPPKSVWAPPEGAVRLALALLRVPVSLTPPPESVNEPRLAVV